MTIASKLNFIFQLAALAAVVAFTVDLIFQAAVSYLRLRRKKVNEAYASAPKYTGRMKRLRYEAALLVGGVVSLCVGILSLEPGRSTAVLTASFGVALAFLLLGVFVNNRRREDSIIDRVRMLRAELGSTEEGETETGITKLEAPKPKGTEAQLALAGIREPGAARRFITVRVFATLAGAVLGAVCFVYVKTGITGPMLAIGAVIAGWLAPGMWLDYKIRQRRDEFLYYIPLAAESFAIAVSGSLDIGGAIQHLSGVARTRGSLNPVIELLEKVKTYVTTGLSIPEALRAVGTEPGIPQASQFFGTLAQFAQHGGEISKQVIELAGAVERERYLQVEYQIARMPVKATGPLAVFFAGSFAVLLAGLFAYLFEAVNTF